MSFRRNPNTAWNTISAILLAATPLFIAPLLAASQPPANSGTQQPAQSGNSTPSGHVNPQPAPTRPARVRANLSGFDLSTQSGGRVVMAPNQIGGASRGLDGSATLYAPHLGKAYTTRPTFFWSAEDAPAGSSKSASPAEPLKFQILNSSGDSVYEKTLTTDHLEYPADAPALSPGEIYRWWVASAASALDPTTRPAAFVIVSGADREAITSELAAISGTGLDSDLARAKVYVDHRLWYDAVAAYTKLIAEHPTDASLRQARADLYNQIPATQALAAADEK